MDDDIKLTTMLLVITVLIAGVLLFTEMADPAWFDREKPNVWFIPQPEPPQQPTQPRPPISA